MPREVIEAYGRPERASEDWFETLWPLLEPHEHVRLVSTMREAVKDADFLYITGTYLLARILEKSGELDDATTLYRELDERVPPNGTLRLTLESAIRRVTDEAEGATGGRL